jgi:hypothetical protein
MSSSSPVVWDWDEALTSMKLPIVVHFTVIEWENEVIHFNVEICNGLLLVKMAWVPCRVRLENTWGYVSSSRIVGGWMSMYCSPLPIESEKTYPLGWWMHCKPQRFRRISHRSSPRLFSQYQDVRIEWIYQWCTLEMIAVLQQSLTMGRSVTACSATAETSVWLKVCSITRTSLPLLPQLAPPSMREP